MGARAQQLNDVDNNAEFPDHFSNISAAYAQHRLTYPPELFQFVSDRAPGHDRAWDCGTGTGQAAVGLSRHFREVIATDASPKQIEQAMQGPNIVYRVAPAEASEIEATSVNVVTVAQVLHWFKLDEFYEEVRRVCIPGGVIVAWCYPSFPSFGDEIDSVSDRFMRDVLDRYWPPEIDYVKEHYKTIPFPFSELPAPRIEARVEWDIGRVAGFARTSSAGQKCIALEGDARFASFVDELSAVWGGHETKRHGTLLLHSRVGRVLDL